MEGVPTLDHIILYLGSQLQKIYIQIKMQRCFGFQDQNGRFFKKKTMPTLINHIKSSESLA
jgi:hypothetical protein